MNKEQYKELVAEQELLIRRVFSTPDGKALLRKLTSEYVFQAIRSNENNVVFRQLGKQELVQVFINATRGESL